MSDMRSGIALAIGILLVLAPARPRARADAAMPGSMSLPLSLADLAAAAGLRSDDPSTLPIDIVRLSFSSPDWRSAEQARRRNAIATALDAAGESGARIPLPLSPRLWRERLLHSDVADARLAPAILGGRPTALIYHGLLALDPETLAWIEANPAVLDAFQKHPGATAVYARSIHVRSGAIVTPGDNATDIWRAILGADPANPAAFIPRLLSSRSGAVATFYDTVAHLDAARQRFVLGSPADPKRVERAMKVFEAVIRAPSSWRLDDYPFTRADVDAALVFRQIALDDHGIPAGPSKDILAQVFGEGVEGHGPVDAEWVAANVLKASPGTARRRLDTLLFAQRALATDSYVGPTLIAVLRDFARYPALMLTLEASGVRGAATYSAAVRVAAGLAGDDEATAVFQAGLTIVDRARVAGTLRTYEARALIDSLIRAAGPSPARSGLLAWLKGDLLTALRRAATVTRADPAGAEALVLGALAGSSPNPPVIEWEGERYSVDPARAELRRLTMARKGQQEPSLDDALAAATVRNMSGLAQSLTALVYALALGEPDSPAASGGAVWQRHALRGNTDAAEGISAWRLATEVFAAEGWHLRGSLLRLDLALARLALRRIDPTQVPAPFSMSTMDQRSLARTIALIEPRAIDDDARDAVAGAIARGRGRVADLATHPDALDRIASDAALSEWRVSGLRWLLANDAAGVPGALTTLELFRLGGGTPAPGWGAAGDALSGCYCLVFPGPTAWEEYTGRASTGQLGTQLADVMLRTADALSARRLPAVLIRDVAAFAMQDVMDTAGPAYFDDWLPVAFAARDLKDDRFDDYVAALTASGPLVPVRRNVPK
jgi:hypothetical protein